MTPTLLAAYKRIPLLVLFLGAIFTVALPASTRAQEVTIHLAPQHSDLEDYAAKELARYLHALSGTLPRITTATPAAKGPLLILGRPGHHPLIDQLIRNNQLTISTGKPGPQGYLLKTLTRDGQETLVITANDETGILYGVYGLLEDHFGISFSFDGDVLPSGAGQAQLTLPPVDEVKTPAVAIRGFLPWTNFPQSATSYSWEDWQFILDQMAKMRMNFLHIHNYTGEEGHNEMFHNFAVQRTKGEPPLKGDAPKAFLSRVWMATARSGHAWGSYPGWEVNNYPFGSAALFDDYDFGADCALHNEKLDNEQVFRKGVNEFQRVIAYAHKRGIKIGLGLDINLIHESYQLPPDDPRVIAARVKQIENDYPALDYLLCFQSESLVHEGAEKARAQWRTIFDSFYYGLKKSMPQLRLAVAGWGLRGEDVSSLPKDVICAPISKYSDAFEDGKIYKDHEYWGCPWLERDFYSSTYYYPYNMHLSNTIKAWQERSPNMKGFYTLTWRITDAVKAKMGFMARAPWDDKKQLNNANAVYRQFATQQYGAAAAALVTPIINEDEPFASDFSECRWTPPFSLYPVDRRGQAAFRPAEAFQQAQAQLDKANTQLHIIDSATGIAGTPGRQYRLGLLRSRIAAVRDHILLNMYAPGRTRDIAAMTRSWVSNFNSRVSDISSLGNVVSMQNRFVQNNYRDIGWKQLNSYMALPPENLEARGTKDGARLYWKTNNTGIEGFYIYRDGKKITNDLLPANTRQYEDKTDSLHHYEVHPVYWGNDAELPSISVPCLAGKADKEAPRIVVISPPTSVLAGQPIAIKARLLDNRSDEWLTATLHYRKAGTKPWTTMPMTRRIKAIYTASIPATAIDAGGMEYYISASDGDNRAVFPADAPATPLTCIEEKGTQPAAPLNTPVVTATKQSLQWQPVKGAGYYHIYRSQQPACNAGREHLLTYMAAGAALRFTDNGMNLLGQPLTGRWYYRITAVDVQGYESKPSAAIAVQY